MTQTQGDTSDHDQNQAEPENLIFDQMFELDHAPERIWEALSEPELLAEWLFPNNMEPTEGARFGFDVPAGEGLGDRIDCEVRHVDPYRSISYTWNVRDRAETGLVTFDLHGTPAGGTGLRIRHTKYAGASLSLTGTAAGLSEDLRIRQKLSVTRIPIAMALAA